MEPQSAETTTPREESKVTQLRDDLRPTHLAPDEIAEFQQLSQATLKVQSEIGALYCDKLALEAEFREKSEAYDVQIGKAKAQLDGHARVVDAMRTRLTRKYGFEATSRIDIATGEITY